MFFHVSVLKISKMEGDLGTCASSLTSCCLYLNPRRSQQKFNFCLTNQFVNTEDKI